MTKEELFEIIETLMMDKIEDCYTTWFTKDVATPWRESCEYKQQQPLLAELVDLQNRFYASQDKDTE